MCKLANQQLVKQALLACPVNPPQFSPSHSCPSLFVCIIFTHKVVASVGNVQCQLAFRPPGDSRTHQFLSHLDGQLHIHNNVSCPGSVLTRYWFVAQADYVSCTSLFEQLPVEWFHTRIVYEDNTDVTPLPVGEQVAGGAYQVLRQFSDRLHPWMSCLLIVRYLNSHCSWGRVLFRGACWLV